MEGNAHNFEDHEPLGQPDDEASSGAAATHRVELEVSHRTANKTFYRVLYRGEELLTSADPEYDACRALLARGITGTLLTRWVGASHDAMRVDIEAGATLRTSESRTFDPRVVKWQPFEGFREEDTD